MHSRIFDSILLLYVHNPNALRLTERAIKEGKIDLAGELTGCRSKLLGPLQVSMFILYLGVQA